MANLHGLHARPTSRVVQAVRTLDARVRLRNLTTDSPWVPAPSLSKIDTLGVLHDHEVEVHVDAVIFDAHLLLLDDAALLGDVRLAVDAGQAAAPAWSASITRIATELTTLPDPYLQARAANVRALGGQVLRALLGVPSGTAGAAGVLVTADLTPAEAAGLDPIRVPAVVLTFSSPTVHSVILLRARGIPVVVGGGPAVLAVCGSWPPTNGPARCWLASACASSASHLARFPGSSRPFGGWPAATRPHWR